MVHPSAAHCLRTLSDIEHTDAAHWRGRWGLWVAKVPHSQYASVRVTNKSEVDFLCPFRRVTSHSKRYPPTHRPPFTLTTIHHSDITSPPSKPRLQVHDRTLAIVSLTPLHRALSRFPYLYNPTRFAHFAPRIVLPNASYASAVRSTSTFSPPLLFSTR